MSVTPALRLESRPAGRIRPALDGLARALAALGSPQRGLRSASVAPKSASARFITAESPGPTVDRITPRIADTAKILWIIYIGFTVAQTALLMIAGMDLFDALTHTFGTLATGGFSTPTRACNAGSA